jgi:Flp pilus assembly protein TadB
MFAGIMLIVCGLLIAAYPPLLSMIVATLLIFSGVIMLTIWYRFKKSARKFDDPFMGFFMGP